MHIWIRFLIVVILMLMPATSSRSAAALELRNAQGEAISTLTDGDLVSLHYRLDEKQPSETLVQFLLSGSSTSIAACSIPAGQVECTTKPFRAYGWYWSADAHNELQPIRQVHASLNGNPVVDASLDLTIQPRPVILVHGFLSDFTAWSNYLGPQGFLAQAGLKGFAVGDNQVDGVMNTGNITAPTKPTNTIAENAEILAAYIQNVKEKTGAQQVDLIGHSMGGLISRYYIDRLMPERDIAQLILLGTPSSGSDCAVLPSALGFYYPTVLEIRSSYMSQVFNQQIKQRRGVPFFALAGTEITSPVGTACTEVPNDMVVSVNSVIGINLSHTETPILHTEMNTSPEVFMEFVLPLLKRVPEATWQEPDSSQLLPSNEPVQFSRIFMGHVNPGEIVEQIITLEPGLAVANFALYDSSQSLEVRVTGASGKEIPLDPEKNGWMVVDNPASLVHMGYGFENPRPGPWIVKLIATNRTPAIGADFALTANLLGGAELTASATPLLPKAGDSVKVEANLMLSGEPVEIQSAKGSIRSKDGTITPLSVTINGSQIQGEWQTSSFGIHAIDLQVTAIHPSEPAATIERSAYLSVEVQPGSVSGWNDLFSTRKIVAGVSIAGIGLSALLLLAAFLWYKRSIRNKEE